MPDLRLTTAAVIRRGDGKILVARRKQGGVCGAKWEFPGGKAESAEEPRAALVRELEEEFGRSFVVREALFEMDFENGSQQYRLVVYLVDPPHGELELREHDRIAWLALTQIAELDMADSDRRILHMLRGYRPAAPC